MKKSLALLLCMLILSLAGAFASCEVMSHEHNFVQHTTPATCTEDGVAEFVCDCGEKITNVIPALGHDEETNIISAPTCTLEGKAEKVCKRCGAELGEEILPPAGHSFEDFEVVEPATCTRDGRMEKVCKSCGAREIKTEPATGHKISGEGRVTLEPTCTEEGKREFLCATCGESVEKPIPPIGHEYTDEWTIDIPATTEHAGERSHHCTHGCGERKDVTPIEKLSETTVYSARLRDPLGGIVPSAVGPCMIIKDKDGAKVKGGEFWARQFEITLPTAEYTVEITIGPNSSYINVDGYSFDLMNSEVKSKTVTLTPQAPSMTVTVYPHMIMDKDAGSATYMCDSANGYNVIYDEYITVVGATSSEDRKVKFSELMEGKKGMLLNLFFIGCSACRAELPSFINAYNAMSSTGKTYADEVAVVMLSNGDSVESLRKYKLDNNIPFAVAYGPTVERRFVTGAYPTTCMIDKNGMYIYKRTAALGQSTFQNLMETYCINRYKELESVGWLREKEGEEAPAPASEKIIADPFEKKKNPLNLTKTEVFE